MNKALMLTLIITLIIACEAVSAYDTYCGDSFDSDTTGNYTATGLTFTYNTTGSLQIEHPNPHAIAYLNYNGCRLNNSRNYVYRTRVYLQDSYNQLASLVYSNYDNTIYVGTIIETQSSICNDDSFCILYYPTSTKVLTSNYVAKGIWLNTVMLLNGSYNNTHFELKAKIYTDAAGEPEAWDGNQTFLKAAYSENISWMIYNQGQKDLIDSWNVTELNEPFIPSTLFPRWISPNETGAVNNPNLLLNFSVNYTLSNTYCYLDSNKTPDAIHQVLFAKSETIYPFDDYKNLKGGNNYSKYNNASFSTGKYGNSLNLLNPNGYANFTQNNDVRRYQDFSISMWLKFVNQGNGKYILDALNDTAPYKGIGIETYGTAIRIGVGNATQYNQTLACTNLDNNEWNHLVIIRENNLLLVYCNGVIQVYATAFPQREVYDDEPWNIGRFSQANWFNGQIDELYIFNKTLNQAEVNWLYHNGTLTNTTRLLSQNPQGTNPTILTVYDNRTGMSYGTYSYNASCFANNSAVFSELNVTLDTIVPESEINTNNFFRQDNFTIILGYNTLKLLNITYTDERDLYAYYINITLNNKTYYNLSNTSLPVGTKNATLTRTLNLSGWPGGTYDVELISADRHTDKRIPVYDIDGFINTITLKTSKKNEITISSDWAIGTSLEKKRDKYTFGFDYLIGTKTHTYTISSDLKIEYYPQSRYKGHFVVWEGKNGYWIDFEGEQGDLTVNKINDNKYQLQITSAESKKHVNFESIGGLNVVMEHYSFALINMTESYNAYILNQFNASYLLNLSGNVSQAEVSLEIDNINYTSQIIQSDVNYTDYLTTIFINQSIAQTGTVSHKYYFQNSDGTSLRNQTVWQSQLGVCEGNKTFPVWNVSYVDEKSGASVIASIGYDIKFFDGQYYYNLTTNYSLMANNNFCTNIPPSNLTYNVDVRGDITLTADGYITRQLSIPNSTATLLSNNPTTLTNYYLIKTNESSTVEYTWTTTDFQLINGVMIVYKCNIDGTKDLVESTNIINGKATSNIELLNSLYYYDVVINEVLYSDPNSFSQCHAESSTSVSYYVDIGTINIDQLIGLNLVECILNQVNNSVYLAWGNNPYDTTYIQGCIVAYRKSIYQDLVIYKNCSVSPSQVVGATIPDNDNTYIVKGKLIQANNTLWCNDQVVYSQNSSGGATFGAAGLFAVFLLVASCSLLYAGQGTKQLLGAIVGLVVSYFMGLFIFQNVIIISSLAMFLVIIAVIGRYR